MLCQKITYYEEENIENQLMIILNGAVVDLNTHPGLHLESYLQAFEAPNQ